MSNQIFHYSNTGISSGQRFYLKDDVSGIFVRNLNIDSNFPVVASNLVYNTGAQVISGVKTFASRPTVNGTGVLLSGEAATLPTTIVYTTGNQTISGIKTFNVAPILSGNPLITGVNLSSYITTGQTGVFYPRNNPSGFITSADLSRVVYTTGNQIISGNKTFAQDTFFGDSTQDNLFVVSGNQITFGVRPTVNGTGVLLSGEAASLPTTIVYTTGNQTISGVKTFASRPTVNGTGFLLSGDPIVVTVVATGDNIVYTTGNQIISGIKTFNIAPILSGNPLITGVNLSSYITTGQTGVFYPRNNPSGFITGVNLSSYITTGQTGVFYPRNNPSGFITSADLSRVVYTTGDQTISGVKTFASRPTVNGTGFLLSGDPIVVTVVATGDNIVYTTGNQIISGNKTFLNNVNISGTGNFNNVKVSSIDKLFLSGIDMVVTGNSSINVYNDIYISGNRVLTGTGGAGISLVSPPLTPTSAGISGQIALDQNYSYFCTSDNNWRRSAIGSW